MISSMYHHTGPTYTEESIRTIYDDSGMPTAVLRGEHISHDVLQMISDEALDELFPLSSQDAAELDASDDFVTTMVYLSFLEECQENSMMKKTKSYEADKCVDHSHAHNSWSSSKYDVIRLLGKDQRLPSFPFDSYLRIMERVNYHKTGEKIRIKTTMPRYHIQQPRKHCS